MKKLQVQRSYSFLRLWVLASVIGVGIVLFSWLAVQQSMRLGANNPQWQIAGDDAARLKAGAAPSTVVPNLHINEASSLATFVTVTDRNRKVLVSSGEVDGRYPLPPAGSFTAALPKGYTWFTWQHDGGVRDAAVIVPYSGRHPGYVLVARSLRQVEDNETHIQNLALLTLVGVLVAPGIILLIP